MNIITVTVNPAIDIHMYAEKLTLGEDNPTRLLRRDSGGKGVNLSRALHSYGVPNLCYMVLGGADAEDFIRPLLELGMQLSYTTVDGFVRENINIHTPDGETVIAAGGPVVSSDALIEMRELLLPKIEKDTVLTFNGRISEGTDKAALLSVLREFSDRGARLVLDSKSLSLDDVISLSPYLIKPNESEAEAMLGIKIESETDALRAARRLYSLGVSNVIITRGADGGVYSGEYGDYIARVPRVEALSTVGAGDSTIAGFLAATMEGRSCSDPLRMALAFGTAACMEEGTLPPDPCRINELFDKIIIYEM